MYRVHSGRIFSMAPFTNTSSLVLPSPNLGAHFTTIIFVSELKQNKTLLFWTRIYDQGSVKCATTGNRTYCLKECQQNINLNFVSMIIKHRQSIFVCTSTNHCILILMPDNASHRVLSGILTRRVPRLVTNYRKSHHEISGVSLRTITLLWRPTYDYQLIM